ncbi:sulfotransferase [Pelagicoccus mobilis]|uniref:Sulfotransferase n=1 Tax=Pelagicoccus mobilis TaxID=415221 RepID=A0A934VLN4_9BACT|nr:sulfotransferase [Pelagicoccus mobilis]MBK1877941.1 sulfotransferase [Pelagicoccus mobilis]
MKNSTTLSEKQGGASTDRHVSMPKQFAPQWRNLRRLAYYWKRNNWMFYLPSLWSDYEDVKIDRPIFLLGNQGDGVTLISRFLRRHTDVVSVTGNWKYWSGADEMQRVMEYRLPRKLRLAGKLTRTDPPHEKYYQPRSWSYGCDELYERYHDIEREASLEDSSDLKKTIRECIVRFSSSETARFLDKSQVYTLKTRYIQALLSDVDPHFALITRDPYAACYRAAKGKARDMRWYSKFLSFDERFELCQQHWKNCMSTVLEDSKSLRRFKVFQYEDFLLEPESKTREMCEFLGLDYEEEMIPAAHQKVPFATKFNQRWYPLRPEVNQVYYDAQTEAQLDAVERSCGELAHLFGYERPRK